MSIVDLFGQPQEDISVEPIPLGGVSSCTRQGRYAEFMVCAFLTKLGYDVLHVDAAGFDLILDYEGESYRVDVKSSDNVYQGKRRVTCMWHTRKNTKVRRIVGGYDVAVSGQQRNLTPHDADLLALFQERFETVVFYAVLRPLRFVSLPASQVQASGYGETSLKAAIKALGG